MPEKFQQRIDYFATLLGLILGSIFIVGRGCIIRDFYNANDEYVFYFPCTNNDFRIKVSEKIIVNEKTPFKKKYIQN